MDALRSPIVNLTALAERVEAAHVVQQCYTSEVYFGKRSLLEKKNKVIYSSSFIVTHCGHTSRLCGG